jgi:hypothetical protein
LAEARFFQPFAALQRFIRQKQRLAEFSPKSNGRILFVHLADFSWLGFFHRQRDENSLIQ